MTEEIYVRSDAQELQRIKRALVELASRLEAPWRREEELADNLRALIDTIADPEKAEPLKQSLRTFVRVSIDPESGRDYETCLDCGKHIRHHYGSPSDPSSAPFYRCDPKPEPMLRKAAAALDMPAQHGGRCVYARVIINTARDPISVLDSLRIIASANGDAVVARAEVFSGTDGHVVWKRATSSAAQAQSVGIENVVVEPARSEVGHG